MSSYETSLPRCLRTTATLKMVYLIGCFSTAAKAGKPATYVTAYVMPASYLTLLPDHQCSPCPSPQHGGTGTRPGTGTPSPRTCRTGAGACRSVDATLGGIRPAIACQAYGEKPHPHLSCCRRPSYLQCRHTSHVSGHASAAIQAWFRYEHTHECRDTAQRGRRDGQYASVCARWIPFSPAERCATDAVAVLWRRRRTRCHGGERCGTATPGDGYAGCRWTSREAEGFLGLAMLSVEKVRKEGIGGT